MSHIEEQEASLTQSVPSLGRAQTNEENKVPGSVDLNRTPPDEKAAAVDAVPLSKKSGNVSALPERTRREKIVSNFQFAALCWSLAFLGWSDATPGPLLPRLREEYGVSFTVVSLVFVVACCGFLLGALSIIWLIDRFQFGTIIAGGAAIQIIAFSVQASAPPFAAFVVVNAVNSFGGALQDALANGFVGSLKLHASTKMGILHAAYGLGAFSSPLVATQFSQMERWSFHYLVSLGLALINTAVLIAVFRFKSQEVCLKEGGEPLDRPNETSEKGHFRQIMTNKAVHYLAFFILFYVGVEVTIGGWIVTYIIEIREGGPSSGYISSGFWGGLTLGRVILLPVNKLVGERRVLFIYAALAFGLDFVIWFVPSLVGNAVVVSIIGLLLGPMYPIAMNQASRVLPQRILTGSIGWIAAFGTAGSALLPFLTGAIADRYGIESLHPFLVAMMAAMVVLFWLTPDRPADESPAPQSDLDIENND